MSHANVWILIPGILQHPEGIEDWADRARDWIHANTEDTAITYEYRVGIIRTKRERKRWVADLIELLCTRYAGRTVNVLTHSNGGYIITEAIKQCRDIHLKALHMVAAAADADFDKNGLNEAILSNRVQRVFLYCSRGDRTLNTWATWSKRLFGWLGLGYGNLGWVGKKHVSDDAEAAVDEIWRDSMDHSTWFTDPYFEWLMHRATLEVTQPPVAELPPTPEEQGEKPAKLVDIPKPEK